MRRYITTAIDFPNAAPHMGHVYEKILADALARWYRLRGDEVRFQVGTDEHGIKIQQTAKAKGVTPKELVDGNAPLFESLFRRIGVSFDLFIRTSDQKTHWPTVVELWKRLAQAGALERRTYHGLYCVGCERFVTKKDLVDGLCPDHKVPPQEVSEENWFYLLKRKAPFLDELLRSRYRIVPEFRAEEVFSFLRQGLEDVSFSRPTSTLSWGVPVPGDEDQTMYVWCDNLTSYISGLGFFTDHADASWWEEGEVTHVIGKDITRFHALNWPAMLDDAGVRTPDRLLVHGFITSDGQKMSKSIGNVVDPTEVLDAYGVDALRFFLLHEIPVGNDGDFTWRRFGEIYDAKLRNQLGNLLNRVLVLLRKQGGGLVRPEGDGADWVAYDACMERCDLSGALQVAMGAADACNKLIDAQKPWTLPPAEAALVISGLAEHLRHIALMLLPFLPDAAARMAAQLALPGAERVGDASFVVTDRMKEWGGAEGWERVGEPGILFAPVERAAAA